MAASHKKGACIQVAEYFQNNFSAELEWFPTGGNNNIDNNDPEDNNNKVIQVILKWGTEAVLWLKGR